ncbi:MAG: rod shape-determining protein MreC [Deltaproteobacteria bacterium]|nr:rod shape-determining protein MreC [Deltaproteobacteria bacterium]MBW1958369.1 rod shape-determining protein MreC [Deltaproteobacteria bacterium]MBW2013625.1 rod shape-determining protein MreC [Deltaproteobacteria bacterium]MBW2089319.1 rod shape-determining protein MreC [Deltaproteobacteria bacterium]
MIIGVIVLIAVNIIILSVSNRYYQSYGPGRIAISLIAPFQEAVSRSIRFVKDIWVHYFFLVETAKENDIYKKSLSHAVEKDNLHKELKLSNNRLRSLLNFQKSITNKVIAAEVIGKDSSPWFNTIMIDKGKDDGVKKGAAVVIPEGIVGQVAEVSTNYSKVLLIIDHNSAVDALVQRTRARGIIKGSSSDRCLFKYVLRKKSVVVGDTVVSSGLDGVFLKGLPVGQVSGVIRPNSGIFQEVSVTPYVDFEKLEEVLVVLNPRKDKFQSKQ